MADSAFRDMEIEMMSGIGNVIGEQAFKRWYNSNKKDNLMQSINAKTIFPLLLEEKFRRLTDGTGSENQNSQTMHNRKFMGAKDARKMVGVSEPGNGKKSSLSRRMSGMWNYISQRREEEGDENMGSPWGKDKNGGSDKATSDEFNKKEFGNSKNIENKNVLRRMSTAIWGRSAKQKRTEGEDDAANAAKHGKISSNKDSSGLDPGDSDDDNCDRSEQSKESSDEDTVEQVSGMDDMDLYYLEMSNRKMESVRERARKVAAGADNDHSIHEALGNYDMHGSNYWGHDHRDLEIELKCVFFGIFWYLCNCRGLCSLSRRSRLWYSKPSGLI